MHGGAGAGTNAIASLQAGTLQSPPCLQAVNPPFFLPHSSPSMPKTDKTPSPKDFESAMQALEQVVAELESGKLSLEDSLAAYKRGTELSAFCQKTLEAAQQQVQILENGELKDFNAAPGNAH